MMKKFAVAYMNYFDNELELSIVEATDWRSALVTAGYIDNAGLDSLPADYKAAQEEAFNQDWQFDIKEL